MFNTINDTGDRGRTASLGNLPSYRDPLSALTTWGPNGALPNPSGMGRVQATMGRNNDGRITKAYVVQNWPNNEHKFVREGQFVFVENDPCKKDSVTANSRVSPLKIVSLGHLNAIIARHYKTAIAMLTAPGGRLPQQVTLQMLRNYDERQIVHYAGRPEALKRDIQDANVRDEMEKIIDVMSQRPFYALMPGMIMRRWLFLGVVSNTNKADSIPDFYHRRMGGSAQAIVANVQLGLRARTSNLWGAGIKTTRPVFFVCRRQPNGKGEYEIPSVAPVAAANETAQVPDGKDTHYMDICDRDATGVVIRVGQIGVDCSNIEPSDYKISEAANLGGRRTVKESADAMAVLPQIDIQLGV